MLDKTLQLHKKKRLRLQLKNQSQEQAQTTSQSAKQAVKDNGGYSLDDDEDDVDDESNSVGASQKTQAIQQSKRKCCYKY